MAANQKQAGEVSFCLREYISFVMAGLGKDEGCRRQTRLAESTE